MKWSEWRATKILRIVSVVIFCAQPALGQANRIPPIYIDEWARNRLPFVVLAGATLGLLVAWFWLPQLLPIPHSNDNWRALKHFALALLLSMAILTIILIIDITSIYSFGRQTYAFKELFSQVFMSLRTFTMFFGAALSFLIVVALWTRFFSRKSYRYMIISR